MEFWEGREIGLSTRAFQRSPIHHQKGRGLPWAETAQSGSRSSSHGHLDQPWGWQFFLWLSAYLLLLSHSVLWVSSANKRQMGNIPLLGKGLSFWRISEEWLTTPVKNNWEMVGVLPSVTGQNLVNVPKQPVWWGDSAELHLDQGEQRFQLRETGYLPAPSGQGRGVPFNSRSEYCVLEEI